VIGRLFISGVALALAGSPLPAMAPALEHEVKAAFIFNFVSFVTWPDDALGSDGEPFRICVHESSAAADALAQTMRGEKVRAHPLVVMRVPLERVALRSCRVLYLTEGPDSETDALLAATRGAATLVVADDRRFVASGAVIAFDVDSGRIRFDVNLDAASQQRLTLSSKLLRIARGVKS
jgi:hypothetical protein